jgi:hypothetical protein
MEESVLSDIYDRTADDERFRYIATEYDPPFYAFARDGVVALTLHDDPHSGSSLDPTTLTKTEFVLEARRVLDELQKRV